MRLSTLIRECSAIIFALIKYEFLLTGSNHPIVLFTDHKPIIYLFTQKKKPNHISININEVSKFTYYLDRGKEPSPP